VAATGVVDAPTWRALLSAHAPKAATKPAPEPANKPAPKPATKPVAKPAPKPAAKPTVAHPELTRHKHLTISYGSRGSAVVALQRRLKVTASGWFGPQTRTAVQRFQRSRSLWVTGRVAPPTWKALGA
jgi:peptidoglycan hydrolase-like protein with peptidoglycan-binding domain